MREVFPFLPDHVFDEYRVVFKTGETLVTQERTVCGGQERFTETHKIPLFDKGKVAQVATVMHNLTTHHRIAMALSESEYRLRTIADTVPAGLCVYQDGRCQYANKMMSVLFGHTEDDLFRQLGPLDLICPEEREAVRAAIDRQLSGDSDVIRLERVCVHKTGRRFPVELTARAFSYEKAPAVLMVFMDISRRRDAERERRLLLAAVEQLNEGLAVTDLNGRVQFVNPAFAQMHGYEVEEVVGKDLSVFHSPEQMVTIQEANRVLWETGVYDGEVWHARKDGSVFPAMMSNVLLRDSAGAGIGMIGTLRDVSRLREAEKAVEVERNLLRAVIDTVPDPLYVKDTDSRFVLANQATARSCKMAGPEELIGKTDYDITSADMATFFREDEVRVMRTGRKARFMDSVPMELTADQRHYLVTKVPLRDASGEVVGIVGFNHDVTALKRAEKYLWQTSERYRQVLNAVPAIIYWADIQERKLLFVDGAVQQIAGCSAEDFVRDCGCFGEIIYPAVVSGERSSMQGRLKPWEFEHRIVGGEDCPVRWVSVRIAPTADHRGRARWVYGVITDITQRKESEAHLVRLAQAIENAGEGIGIWGSDGRLKYVNPEMTRLLGFETAPEQLRGRSWGSLLDGTEPRWRTDLVVTLEQSGKWAGNLLAKRGDGMVIPVAVTLSSLGTEAGRSEVVVNLRDRTAEENYLAQIRKLAAGTDRLLEEERTRIARELHDELGQLVTALGLSLAWIRRSTPRVRAEVRERMREAAGLGEQITAIVRDMSRSLRPPILDHQGFLAAAKSLVVDFRKATGLPCRFIADVPDTSLGVAVVNAAYRILQESLTNVARHSHASQCGVTLKLIGRLLVVTVEDDGVGASEAALAGQGSLGIVGMRERAAAVGGHWRMENMPEGGVCVTAELPLVQAPSN
ncbi:MAG: PAS domain S-box protein [Phycisphaerae bacterium]|nr:PAS domain S-box protein [Phycisphaerae bacterium]